MKSRPILKVLLGSLLILIVVILALILSGGWWRRPWIEPVPGVRLEPARPILDEADFAPDSAFGLLQRACSVVAQIRPNQDERTQRECAERLRELSTNTEEWSEEKFWTVSLVLDQWQEALDLGRKAAVAPDPQVPSLTSVSSRVSYMKDAQELLRLFTASAARKGAQGDYEGAFYDLATAVDLGDLFSRGGALIHRAVAMSFTTLACQQMRYMALANDLPHTVAEDAIAHLRKVDANTEPWAEVFRYERLCIQSVVPILYGGAPIGPLSGTFSGSEEALRRAATALGPTVGSTPETTRENLDALYSHLISLAGNPPDLAAAERFQSSFVGKARPRTMLTARDPVGLLLAIIAMPVYGTMTARHLQVLYELRATQIVLALRQFQAAEKHLPASLSELVPRHLPAVPLDPYDGQPLRYRSEPDGSWIVYSVGPNKADDGGMQLGRTPPRSTAATGDAVLSSRELEEARAKHAAKSKAAKEPPPEPLPEP